MLNKNSQKNHIRKDYFAYKQKLFTIRAFKTAKIPIRKALTAKRVFFMG